MKKLLSLLLCLALLCPLLAVGASAYDVVLSPQKLMVNGQYVECEKYNIDGSNYFKLRDLAFLLKDTAAVFGVDYIAAENAVQVVPGMPYVPNGSELAGGDDLTVPSAQRIWIMGTDSAGLSIYNIGGNNFFRLRDMGPALGFLVDYDAATDTAVIETADYAGADKVAQPLAFDKLRDWVRDNYTFASGDDLYYLMANEAWDDGNVCEYWLADVTVDGAPMLMLRTVYFFADGSAGETRVYMPRAARPYDGEYFYYFEYGADAAPDFTGRATLDPAAFDADVGVAFNSTTPGFDRDNIDVAANNMTLSVARLVDYLDELTRSEPGLFATVSYTGFGFPPAATDYGRGWAGRSDLLQALSAQCAHWAPPPEGEARKCRRLSR